MTAPRMRDAPLRRDTGPPAVASARGQLNGALTGATVALILLIYHDTLLSMVGIWARSQTFAHGFVIFPISLWLIWSQRTVLLAIPQTASVSALVALALAGALWLLATLANVQVLAQYALVAMIPASVCAILGTRLAGAIAFPLGYLLLAVPSGEILIAPLIDFTARFTVAALQLVGVPVYRDNNVFSIPSGNWSVVEACSGLRYLIASFTLGTLYAYRTYRTLARRMLFVAVALLLPVLANGVRAFLIVLIGHWSEMRIATGIDHLVYGWAFFGAVLLLLFWLGQRWRELPEPARCEQVVRASPASIPAIGSGRASAFACVLIALLWPALAARARVSSAPGTSAAPIAIHLNGISANWRSVDTPDYPWLRRHRHAHASVIGSYARAASVITVQIAHYRQQQRDAELLDWENGLDVHLAPHASAGPSTTRTITLGPTSLSVRQTVLPDVAGNVLVWVWFRQSGVDTSSALRVKLLLASSKLLGYPDDGVEMCVATPIDEQPEHAAVVLSEFLAANYAAILRGVHDVSND